jgi:hypothetical protein
MSGDARRWRDRAEELRMAADGLHSEGNKLIALRLAEAYDRMAESAELREKRSLEASERAPFPRLSLK